MERFKQAEQNGRRRFLQLLAGSGGATLLAACGSAPAAPAAGQSAATSAPAAAAVATTAPAMASGTGSKATITVMTKRGELSEDQQKQFETENADVAINFVEDDPTKLFALIAAGTPPDLFRVQAPDVPQLLARNLLLDLTPYFQTSKLIKIDDLAPANNYYKANSPTEVGTGKIYGMVKDWSPDFTLFAYKKAFAEAKVDMPDLAKPLTYAELGDLAKQLTKRDGDRTARWGYAYPADWIDRMMMNFLAEKGQKLYSDDFTKLNLTSNPEAVAIATYFYGLAKDNLVPNPLNPSATWPGEDFTKGTVGIAQYGYWFSAMAESDVTKDNVVMLPAPTWAGKRLDPTITATGMVMSKASKSPEAAWKVFEWYTAGKPSTDRSSSGWGVPGLSSQYPLIPKTSPFQQQANALLQTELQYSNQPIQFSPYLNGDTFAKVWAKHLETALRGQSTMEQMLQNVEQEVNQAIQDGKDKIS